MTASWIANIFLVLMFVPQFEGQGVLNDDFVEEKMRISELNAEKIEDQFETLTGSESSEEEMGFQPNYGHQNTLTGGGQRYQKRKVFNPNYDPHQNSLTGGGHRYRKRKVFNPNYDPHQNTLTEEGQRYQKRKVFNPNYGPPNTLTGGGQNYQNEMVFKPNGGGQRYRRKKVFKPNYDPHQNTLPGEGYRYPKKKVFKPNYDYHQDTLTDGYHNNQNQMAFKPNYDPHNEYSNDQQKPLAWWKEGKNYFINFKFNDNENRRVPFDKNSRFQPYRRSNTYKYSSSKGKYL